MITIQLCQQVTNVKPWSHQLLLKAKVGCRGLGGGCRYDCGVCGCNLHATGATGQGREFDCRSRGPWLSSRSTSHRPFPSSSMLPTPLSFSFARAASTTLSGMAAWNRSRTSKWLVSPSLPLGPLCICSSGFPFSFRCCTTQAGYQQTLFLSGAVLLLLCWEQVGMGLREGHWEPSASSLCIKVCNDRGWTPDGTVTTMSSFALQCPCSMTPWEIQGNAPLKARWLSQLHGAW